MNRQKKVATFAKTVNVCDIGPEFQLFDMELHREGNHFTFISHEYYKPSYRTHFRRRGRRNKRPATAMDDDDSDQPDGGETIQQMSIGTEKTE